MHTYDDSFAEPWREDEEVVLLHHGLLRNGNFFRTWVPFFRRQRVLRPDLPGTGLNSDMRVPDGGYTTEYIVEAYRQLLEERGILGVHWIGESMGGAIGAAVAGRYPGLVKSLTVIQTPPDTFDAGIEQSMALGYPTLRDALSDLGIREWWLRARTATDMDMQVPRIDEWMASEAEQITIDAALAQVAWARSWSWKTLAPDVQCPVLFIWQGVLQHKAHEHRGDPTPKREELVGRFGDARMHIVRDGWRSWTPFHPGLLAPIALEFIDTGGRDPVGAEV